MNEFAHVLREFPFLGAFLGTTIGLIGAVAFFFIFGRKINPMYANIVKDLGDAEKVLIESHKSALLMQKEHYEAEIDYNKGAYAKLEGERNDYRSKLHEEKIAHQATLLQVSELQARPDVEKIYKDQKGFFTEMVGTMKAMHQSIIDHDSGIEKRTEKIIQPVKDMCGKVVEAIQELKR
jgi:hypothetical protein